MSREMKHEIKYSDKINLACIMHHTELSITCVDGKYRNNYHYIFSTAENNLKHDSKSMRDNVLSWQCVEISAIKEEEEEGKREGNTVQISLSCGNLPVIKYFRGVKFL